MTLSKIERDTIVDYRLENARKALEQVSGVGSLGYWTLAANRLYYAAYYASVALLITAGIETTTHRGVLRLVNYKFVKEGLLPTEDGKMLALLFNMRQTGDYDDLFDWTESDVMPKVPQVAEYIDRVSKLVETLK